MAKCCACNNFYPPGFTQPVEGTKLFKCKFCIQGKDKIMSISNLTGSVQWDIKDKIIREYKFMLDKMATDSKARMDLYKNIKK